MNYFGITKGTLTDGPGVRISLHVSGCDNHCKGCFLPESWNPKYGKKFDSIALGEIIHYLSKPTTDGLTIIGGDPLYPDNQWHMRILLDSIRSIFGFSKSIWLYTGYKYEDLLVSVEYGNDTLKEILDSIDVLVDGPYMEEYKEGEHMYRGSSNQRLIDMRKTAETGHIVEVSL